MTAETTFGAWLQQRRKALDLTQEALAQQIGCTRDMLRKIEADTRRPSQQLAERLADTLGLDAEQRPSFVRFARAPAGAPPPLSPAVIAAFAPRLVARQRHTRLPRPLTALLGRERELAAIERRLLQDGARLLSLVGPPGVGKTRLALQAALALRDRFADGAGFVELAALADAALVAAAIARALGVREEAGLPLTASLLAYLEDRHLLLVLDNFEHLLAAAPLVAELLAGCPWLSVLATSRAALRLRGERLLNVPPLALPADAASAELIAAAPTVALFVQRAQEVDERFALSAANAAMVAAICARLDGLPLAIELAAARSNLFSPAELLARLADRLALLADGPRDLPARQQTLRNTVEWSYQLLGPAEQRLFARLGVFVGGTTTPAVAAICADAGDPAPTLERLLGQSLLLRSNGRAGEPRLAMLETLREYALERLELSGEGPALRARHAGYFLALAEQAEPQLHGAQQTLWLDRLEDEHANLRAALAWAAEHDPTLGARLAGALHWFWYARNHYSEGRAWLQAAAGWAGPDLPAVAARVAAGAGSLAYAQGDHHAATAHHEQAFQLYQAADDSAGAAFALNNLGVQALQQVQLQEAAELLARGLAAAEAAGDPWVLAVTQANLGVLHLQNGDVETSVRHYERSLSFGQAIGDRWIVGAVLHNLAEVVALQGDHGRALALYEASLTVSREWADQPMSAHTLQQVGHLALSTGDLVKAGASYRESLLIFWDGGVKRGIAAGLEGLASVAVKEGAGERAARLYGAAETLRERSNTPIWPAERPAYEQAVAALRTHLAAEQFGTAWDAGRALSLEQAIEQALSEH